jgi:Holliday junction resolvase
MSRYNKGARGERELLKIFSEAGFSVIRAAGSGVSSTSPPDILLFKQGRQFALECKAWNRNRIAIAHDKYHALSLWEANTGIEAMIAWKIPYRGWKFVPIADMEQNPASYSITLKRTEEIGKDITYLLGTNGNVKKDDVAQAQTSGQ